jgi:hypothetical protein
VTREGDAILEIDARRREPQQADRPDAAQAGKGRVRWRLRPRTNRLAAIPPTNIERGQRPSRWLAFEVVRVSPPIVGRLRLLGLHRVPSCRFTVSGRGSRASLPTHVRAFPYEHPPPRLHVAFSAPDWNGTT